jgi:uncharacterized protein (TIGR02145 family)/uncharacterized repeat protein (TIGR02543 family)
MKGIMMKKSILKMAVVGVFAALFCVGCGEKGDDGGGNCAERGLPNEATFTITFDAAGGEVTPSSGVVRTYPTTCGRNGPLVSIPPTPTRDGYTFRGWFREANGNEYEVLGTGDFYGDQTIYAHWSLTHYSITFDAHGGEVTPVHDTTGDDWRLASLPTPTRADHTFDGWYMDVVGVREKVTEANVYRADVTLYAHWVYNRVHYTVTFDANGGTVDPPTEETDAGGVLQDLPTPERDGYAFTGWYTEKTGGSAVSTSTVFNSAATVYAQWILITPKMYTVTFNAHGGIVTPKSGTAGEDGKLLVPLPTPTREGYTFMGWYTEEDKVTDNTVFRENTAIHATWNIIHYTVTFDATGGTVTPTTTKTGSNWEIDTLPTPKREGYTFIGWYTEKEGGTHVFTKNTVLIGDIGGNIRIYAHWAENPPSLVDERDGKAYKEVAIGEQIWMAENLKYNAPGSRCLYDDDANCDAYGRLYEWNTAVTVCPAGWRLPSDDDWNELLEFIGGAKGAGVKLRAATGWNRYNGTDDYGFSALPDGPNCNPAGGCPGFKGSWWSASTFEDTTSSFLDLNVQTNAYFMRSNNDTAVHGVRCLKN